MTAWAKKGPRGPGEPQGPADKTSTIRTDLLYQIKPDFARGCCLNAEKPSGGP